MRPNTHKENDMNQITKNAGIQIGKATKGRIEDPITQALRIRKRQRDRQETRATRSINEMVNKSLCMQIEDVKATRLSLLTIAAFANQCAARMEIRLRNLEAR
jgi:hypothetical protein